MSTMLFFVAGAVLIGGAIIFGMAKKGEQSTLGGLIMLVGLTIAASAALFRVAWI